MITRVLVLLLAVTLTAPALAQKAGKTEKTAKTEKPTTTQVQQTGFRDLLTRLEGKATNLGIVKKVGPDYFTVEEEGTTTTYAFSALQGIRTIRDEESQEERIELLLVALE
jgi:hypothetical protein